MTRKTGEQFVALDGESTTDGEDHRYVLLASSDGRYIQDERGLSTLACLEFLLWQRIYHKTAIFVGFAFNYDVNMILKDLSFPQLAKLWKEKRLWIKREGNLYLIEWLPGKIFTISYPRLKVTFRLSDTFGFFQSSFLKALNDWHIGDDDLITRMKGERSNFAWKDIDEIRRYCLRECETLVELMRQLDTALKAANLRPKQWCGAGSIAATLLRREGVARYMARDYDDGGPIDSAILHAYYGGRVEMFQQGPFENVYAYDITSAYPTEAMSLPDSRGWWYEGETLDDDYSIWRVSWNLPPTFPVCPFPHRLRRAIRYPSAGEGWYFAREIRSARRLCPKGSIVVHEGRRFVPRTAERPFAFIPLVFEERAAAKRAGHAKEKVLKLGLNAIYGKLAQGYGYRGKLPPFRSFLWAGLITSGTRARLLDAAAENPSAIISFATDGIVTREKLNLPLGKNLGDWEYKQYDDFFIAQPGIYCAENGEGEIRKSRGFFVREIDFDDLRHGFASRGWEYVSERPSRRFLGIGSAIARGKPEIAGSWKTDTRHMKLQPSRKFPPEDWIPGEPIRLRAPSCDGVMSEAYVPKGSGLEQTPDSGNYIEGLEQPSLDTA